MNEMRNEPRKSDTTERLTRLLSPEEHTALMQTALAVCDDFGLTLTQKARALGYDMRSTAHWPEVHSWILNVRNAETERLAAGIISMEQSVEKLSISDEERNEILNAPRTGLGGKSVRDVIASGNVEMLLRAQKMLRELAAADPKETRDDETFKARMANTEKAMRRRMESKS